MRVNVSDKGDRLYYKLIDNDNRDLFEESFISIYERKRNYIFLDYLNLSKLPCEENIDFNLDNDIELLFSDERVDYVVTIARGSTELLMTDKMNPNNQYKASIHIIINEYNNIEEFLNDLYSNIVEPRYSFVCEDINSDLIDSHSEHHEKPQESIYSNDDDSVSRDHFGADDILSEDEVEAMAGEKPKSFGKEEIKACIKRKLGSYRGRLFTSISMIFIFIFIFLFSGILNESTLTIIMVFLLVAVVNLSMIANAIRELYRRNKILKAIELDNSTITVIGKPNRVMISTYNSNKVERYIDMIRLYINGNEVILIPNKAISVRENGGIGELTKRLKEMNLELEVYNESRVVDISKGRILSIVNELDKEI